MNYIISGGWGYGNWGDEAILYCSIKMIELYKGTGELTILSYNSSNIDRYREKYQCNLSLHRLVKDGMVSYKNMLEWAKGKDVCLSSNEKKYVNMFSENDIFIMCGGGYFNEEWEESFRIRVLEILLAKRKKSKIYIHGQTIGPIGKEKNKKILYYALNMVNKIYVRDKGSYNLMKSIKLHEKTEIIPDVVNCVPDFHSVFHTTEEYVVVMFCSYRYHRSEKYKYRGKTLLWLGQKFKTILGLRKKYNKKIKTVLRSLIEEGQNIKYIVSTEWDYQYACEIAAKLGDNIEIVKSSSVFEYLNLLSGAQIIISTNMHPIVIGHAYNVPVVAISYGFKTDNYMEEIGLSEALFNIDYFDEKKIIECIKNKKFLYGKKVDKNLVYTSVEKMFIKEM